MATSLVQHAKKPLWEREVLPNLSFAVYELVILHVPKTTTSESSCDKDKASYEHNFVSQYTCCEFPTYKRHIPHDTKKVQPTEVWNRIYVSVRMNVISQVNKGVQLQVMYIQTSLTT